MSELTFKKIEAAKVAAKYRIRLTLDSDMLGTKPCSADIAQRFLQDKMNKADRAARDLTEEDRIAKANEAVEKAEKALTIVYKDENGIPVIQGYQILGFLKEAAATQNGDKTKLASEFFGASIKGRIEQAFNVPDYFIKISLPEGYDPYETILEDGKEVKRWKQLERPLRSDQRGIQIVSIAKSEIIPAGSTMEFDLEIRSDLIPTGSAKNAPKVDAYELLCQLLGEGIRRGLGQWRNGGYGRFTAEIAEL